MVSSASQSKKEKQAMKPIITALVALAVFAGIAAPAGAFDAKTFWEQQERTQY
jgi:hypothetical protein